MKGTFRAHVHPAAEVVNNDAREGCIRPAWMMLFCLPGLCPRARMQGATVCGPVYAHAHGAGMVVVLFSLGG